MNDRQLYGNNVNKGTVETLQIALNKSIELKCPIVLASTGGICAKLMADLMKERQHPYPLIIVTHCNYFKENVANEFDTAIKTELLDQGIPVITSTHALSAGERSLSKTMGGTYPLEIVANTLRMFSQGIKVCVEITLMACDHGTIDMNETIVALGGSGHGTDSCCILTAQPSHLLLQCNIQEILCMPKE